jgi:C1A family cysteine protease
LIKKKKMKKPIAMLMTAIMILSITASALPLSAYAATDDNLYGGGVDDIKAPQLAPLNPDFVAYKENPPEIFYGYIPPPMDLSHLDQIPVVGLPTLDKLPSSFDWRDYGKVTPVKDQNPCGTCWTFGTTSVLESAVLIGESVEYDFSEQSVALCVDRSWYYLYDGPTDPCNGGGWSWMASEVFIKKGSVQESCNPYDTSALNCDGSCVCDDCPTVKKVEGYRLATNDGSQLDVIKNAVYNQGPVTVAYYHDFGEYWDPTWGPIYDYYPCSDYVNHMISIIGWDDDVPHPNPGHTGTGAWIVKNSWGTADSWADGAGVSDGYFYLAYDSSCANEIAYLEYKDPVSGEKLLYWDEAGFVNSVGYSDNSAWMANVFTAHGSGDLTHVDFWTMRSMFGTAFLESRLLTKPVPVKSMVITPYH